MEPCTTPLGQHNPEVTVADAEFVKGEFQIGGMQSALKNFANDHARFRLETAFAILKFPSALARYCKDSTIIEKVHELVVEFQVQYCFYSWFGC